MVIDAASHGLEELMAILQLSQSDSLSFRCQKCGHTHRLSARAWEKCCRSSFSYSPHTQGGSRRALVRIEPEDTHEGVTKITLPWIVVQHPRIVLYKLVFYPRSQMLKLLTQYVQLVYQLYGTGRFRDVVLFNHKVPLSLILTPQQYRELIYRLIVENRSYQEYICSLKQTVAQMAKFICQYPDLFVPYTSKEVIIENSGSSSSDLIIRTPYQSIHMNTLLAMVQSMLPVEAWPAINCAYSVPNPYVIISGWVAYSHIAYKYTGQDVGFSFLLTPTTSGELDTTDQITHYLTGLARHLKEMVIPAVQAVLSYVKDTPSTNA